MQHLNNEATIESSQPPSISQNKPPPIQFMFPSLHFSKLIKTCVCGILHTYTYTHSNYLYVCIYMYVCAFV